MYIIYFYRSNNEFEMKKRMKSKYGDDNNDKCETKSERSLGATTKQRNAQILRVLLFHTCDSFFRNYVNTYTET